MSSNNNVRQKFVGNLFLVNLYTRLAVVCQKDRPTKDDNDQFKDSAMKAASLMKDKKMLVDSANQSTVDLWTRIHGFTPHFKDTAMIFEGLTFNKLTVDLENLKEVVFEDCTFNEELTVQTNIEKVSFLNCTIKNLHLSSVNMGSLVKFDNDSDEDRTEKDIKLTVLPSGPGKVVVGAGSWSIEVQDAEVSTNIKNEFEFNGTRFIKFKIQKHSFSNKLQLSHCRFVSSPEFHDVELYHLTRFDDCVFEELSPVSERNYGQLKHMMAETKNKPMEELFAAYELESRLSYITFWSSNWFEKCIGWCHMALTDLGRNLTWPVYWLLGIGAAFTLILYVRLGVWGDEIIGPLQGGPAWSEVAMSWETYCKAIYISFIGSLGPLRLLAPMNPFESKTWVQATIGFVHIMSSSLLWFFIIINVRKRFMLKE